MSSDQPVMGTKKLNRRDLLKALGLAAAGTALAACGPAPTPAVVEKVVTKEVEKVVTKEVEKVVEKEKEVIVTATAAPMETVQLRLAEGSWVGPEGIKYWTDEIIPRFELENPGIKVTFESAEGNDYADKLYTQAVAGDAPDVFFIWWSAGLMEQGQLMVLDDYFDKEYLKDFYPGNVVGQVYEGHLYGVPKYVSTVAMAYNKKILDEAGVAYPDDNWRWDDYLKAFKACTKRDASGNITQWGTYVVPDYLQHYVWMNGGEWMNADLFGTKCLLDGDKAIEALKFNYDHVYGPDPVAPQPGSIPNFDWSNVFSTGKIAFVDSHSWTVTNYMRENDFPWDFVMLASAPDGNRAGLTFMNGYSIYAHTKHPQESVKLVTFLASPWAEKAGALSIVGLQPARRSVVDQWDKNSLGAQAGKNVAAFTKIMDYARLVPIFKDDKEILDQIFNPVWEKIWVTGETPLEEGVKTIVDRINQHFAS
jgi:multiple sugar transport system substrate-binding protein